MSKILISLTLFLVVFGCKGVSAFDSKNYNGSQFVNQNGVVVDKPFSDMYKFFFEGEKQAWPEWVDIKQRKIDQERVKDGQLSITFINHSTVLVQMDNINILTDPIWSKRASPVSFAGPKRVKLPGVKLEDLPRIDVILISHNHYDHLDLETVNKIAQRDNPKILLGLGNKYLFSDQFDIIELDWQQKYKLQDIEITFMPCQHWSKRSFFNRNQSLWGAFVIEGKNKVYFAGDTGYSQHFKNAGAQFNGFDVALLPIGGYEPRWFMKTAHINSQEAYLAHKELQATFSVAIHHGTFQLTYESIDEPVKKIKQLDQNNEFIVLQNGETFKFNSK